jgi:adhesin transport system membrane fusion protein
MASKMLRKNATLPPIKASETATSRITQGIVSGSQRFMIITLSIGVSLFFLWASLTEIDVVTRGSGVIVPSLQNQIVQHLEGGIVEQILVREGQEVAANEVLMRIKDSFSEAEFTNLLNEFRAQTVRLARLEAESRGLNTILFPDHLMSAEAAAQRNVEEKLFVRRRAGLNERISILRDQTYRKTLERRELETRLKNTKIEYDLVAERVKSLTTLVKSGAASRNELLKNQTTLQQIQTKISDLSHEIPQIEIELSELNRKQKEINLAFAEDVGEEIIQTTTRVEQLNATVIAMRDRSKRVDVRAPIRGKVHKLFHTTEGGVVQGGENLVQLVPIDAPISVEVRLSPKDRAKIWKDMPAIVKLTAYDFSIFGGIRARVTDISADIFREDGLEPYFRVKLEADTSNFGDENPIVAGMAADADIITGRRTIMNYILSPVRDIRQKALREG